MAASLEEQELPSSEGNGGEQPQPRMVDCAVSLRFLINFCNTVPEDMPTWKVVTDVIVPATRDRRCRYVEVIEPCHVGRCDYFISHRWASPFSHLVRYVRKHLVELGDVREGEEQAGEEADAAGGVELEEAPRRSVDEVFVWCDIFAINQHPGQVQADDLAQLKDCVVTSAQTLLCLDDKGLVLTRIWCLYEIWNTVLAGGASKLAVLGYDVNQEAFKEVYITLDVAEAQATVDSDRVRILADIAASTGLQELNLVIKRALVESTEAEAENAQVVLLPKARNWGDVQRIIEAINKHTQMLTSVGRHQEASRYGNMVQGVSERFRKEQARKGNVEVVGETAVRDAAAAADGGASGEDESLLPDWHWRRWPRNPSLRQLLDRAQTAERHGRFDAAMGLYREAVTAAEALQGGGGGGEADGGRGLQLDLSGCLLRLAVFLVARGYIEQACKEAAEPAARGYEAAAGPDSLTYASAAYQAAAVCKRNNGSTELRAQLLASAYAVQETQLGPAHPATLDTLYERAETTYMEGDSEAGLQLYHTVAVRLSGLPGETGLDFLAATSGGGGGGDGGGGAAAAVAPLSSKALEVWYLLASYLGNQAGRENDAITVCRGLIPYKRRDYIQRLYEAAEPGGEYTEMAIDELRRLWSRAGVGPPTEGSSAGGGAKTGEGAADACTPSIPARADLDARLRDALDDPDDPRLDTVGHMSELVTWSTALAKQGLLEDAVRMQWRTADICRNNKQMADVEIQLPTGKVNYVTAYERCLVLDLSVPGVAKVAARMLAERDGGQRAAAAADGGAGGTTAADGAAGAAPSAAAAYDGSGYLELVQEMTRLWVAQEYGPAEALCRRIVAVQAAGHGAVSKEVVEARRQLASLLQSAGKREEGISEMRAALAVHEQILHGKDPAMSQTLQALAHMLGDERAEAEALFRRAVALVEKVYGPDHMDVGMALVSLGGFLMSDMDRLAEGHATFDRGMAIQQKFRDDQAARAKAF